MRYPFTLSEMAIIKQPAKSKCWRRCGEKGTLLHCWWDYKLIHPLRRTVLGSLKKKKLKIKLPYDPAIPLLGIYMQRKQKFKRIQAPPMLTAVFIDNSQDTEAM